MQFEAIWMGPEIITLSEASKRKTNTISYYFFWHLKKKIMQLNLCTNRTDSQTEKTNSWVEGEGRTKQDVGLTDTHCYI